MTDDIPLEPIEDAERISCAVIDLAGMRVALGRPPVRSKTCQHKSLVYDTSERRVWCEDCERTIDSFDAFMGLVREFHSMLGEARSRKHAADEALKAVIHRKAAKALARAWSGHVMAVACPHCKRGLLPEDFEYGGASQTCRDLEIARRKKEAEARAKEIANA